MKERKKPHGVCNKNDRLKNKPQFFSEKFKQRDK